MSSGSVVFAYFILSEPVTTSMLAGGAMILLGCRNYFQGKTSGVHPPLRSPTAGWPGTVWALLAGWGALPVL